MNRQGILSTSLRSKNPLESTRLYYKGIESYYADVYTYNAH